MAKDIILDDDGDVLITAKGIVMGDASKSNLLRLVNLNTGMLRHAPLVGCNIYRLVNARYSDQLVLRDIRLQLKADGWVDETVTYDGKNLDVNAVRAQDK